MTIRSIAGDALAAELDSVDGIVEVRPSPTTWASLKPRALARRHGVRFVAFPACAIGGEYRELPVSLSPRAPYHPPCARCAVRTACSPPHAWNEELQPFRGGDPYELWCAWHERLARVLDLPRDERLDALVRGHLRAVASTAGPLTLEPSVVIGDRLEPAVRLAVFHGLLPRDPSAARAATLASIDSVASMADALGTPPPHELFARLRDLAPFRAPVGFEAVGSRILLKLYLELDDRTPAQKRAIVEAFAPGSADEVMLIGLAFDDRLRSTKTYVRADPEGASPALAALAGGRALRVTDLLGGKPAKWDFEVRRELLSGTSLVKALRHVVPNVELLGPLLAHHDFRSDCVAIGERDGRHTLYLDLA